MIKTRFVYSPNLGYRIIATNKQHTKAYYCDLLVSMERNHEIAVERFCQDFNIKTKHSNYDYLSCTMIWSESKNLK